MFVDVASLRTLASLRETRFDDHFSETRLLAKDHFSETRLRAKTQRSAKTPRITGSRVYRFLPQLSSSFSLVQTKFAASSVLPLPLYLATCGYGHSGRDRTTGLFGSMLCLLEAMI
jgi:hypothetical protein